MSLFYSYLLMFIVLTTVDSLFSSLPQTPKPCLSIMVNVSLLGLCFPHPNSGRGSISDMEEINNGSVVAHFGLLKGSYKGRALSVKRKREEGREKT